MQRRKRKKTQFCFEHDEREMPIRFPSRDVKKKKKGSRDVQQTLETGVCVQCLLCHKVEVIRGEVLPA